MGGEGPPHPYLTTTYEFTVSDGGQSLSLTNPIPEPSTLSLAGLAMLGLTIRRKR